MITQTSPDSTEKECLPYKGQTRAARICIQTHTLAFTFLFAFMNEICLEITSLLGHICPDLLTFFFFF